MISRSRIQTSPPANVMALQLGVYGAAPVVLPCAFASPWPCGSPSTGIQYEPGAASVQLQSELECGAKAPVCSGLPGLLATPPR